jgi:hypothetical protein
MKDFIQVTANTTWNKLTSTPATLRKGKRKNAKF